VGLNEKRQTITVWILFLEIAAALASKP